MNVMFILFLIGVWQTSFAWLMSFSVSSRQDIECYVIDNNGFVLISKQRTNVS